MTDTPWRGDAVSLVEAFRSGERSPLEELRATFAAISRSKLNAFCFLDREAAERDAKNADVSLPFGGVPFGVKELDNVTGWPDNTTASAFLGLTFQCARCHDHKFDPFTQRDWYALAAAFAGSKEVEVPIIPGMGIADFRQHYPRLIAADEARRAYRLFEQRAKGRDLSDAEKKEKQQLLESIANAILALPQSDAQGIPFDGLMEVPTVSVLGHERPELVPLIRLLNRGELKRPRELVSADLPAVLRTVTDYRDPLPGPFGSRKRLALWITASNHPLTARVLVNRVWHWHFGQIGRASCRERV